MRILALLALSCGLAASSAALAEDPAPALYGAAPAPGCGPAPTTTLTVPVVGHPFSAIPSANGCSVYVSLAGISPATSGNIGLLKRDGDVVTVAASVPVHSQPAIMALTHDGKMLVAADAIDVAFIDPVALAAGQANAVLGYINEKGTGVVSVAISPDDNTLFVADESSSTITIIDLEKVRAGDFTADTVLGKIPVGRSPVGLVVSTDGKYLYSTSQIAPASAKWPIVCMREGQKKKGVQDAQGMVMVADAQLARTSPATAVLALVPSGCNTVRVALSPDNATAYATARGSNEVFAFDTAKMVPTPDAAQTADVPVGTSPVGITLTVGGGDVVVTNSDRFNTGTDGTLSAIDTAKITSGAGAVLGIIETGAFPRELSMTSGGTMLVTNFTSNTVQFIPTNPLPLQPTTDATAPTTDTTPPTP
jgi:YVTN family beta-propeller protein